MNAGNPENLCAQFLQLYHSLFDTNRAECAKKFFTDASTFQFEGENLKGLQQIGTKLTSLNVPANVQRIISTKDIQPSSLGMNALVIFVTGKYAGQLFQEALQLVPNQQIGNGLGYYIHNIVFRYGQNNAFNTPPEVKDVSQMFLEHYFGQYDSTRDNLGNLFKETKASVLSHEGTSFMGRNDIMTKLKSLPNVMHNGQSFTVDVQCVNEADKPAILFMLMSGQIVIDENQINEIKAGKLTIDKANQIKFAQVFQIVKENNSYYIGNQLFRLNYGN